MYDNARHFAKILQPLVGSPTHHVKNWDQFASLMQFSILLEQWGKKKSKRNITASIQVSVGPAMSGGQ